MIPDKSPLSSRKISHALPSSFSVECTSAERPNGLARQRLGHWRVAHSINTVLYSSAPRFPNLLAPIYWFSSKCDIKIGLSSTPFVKGQSSKPACTPVAIDYIRLDERAMPLHGKLPNAWDVKSMDVKQLWCSVDLSQGHVSILGFCGKWWPRQFPLKFSFCLTFWWKCILNQAQVFSPIPQDLL